MRRLKFLHFSDLHLDLNFTTLDIKIDGRDRKSERRQELLDIFDKIIDLSISENVDAVFISGDLYEHQHVRKSTINHLQRGFNKICDKEIFIISGNHDPYINNSYYKDFKWGKNVHILKGKYDMMESKALGLRVYGIGFCSYYQDQVSIDIKEVNKDFINVLLFHGTIDLSIGSNMYNPVNSNTLAQLGMDYIGAGHFHNRIDDVGKKGVIYNPGSPEPLGFDEDGEHGIYIGEISKDLNQSLNIRFIRTNKRFYKTIVLNNLEYRNDNAVIEAVEQAVGENLSVEDIIKVVLKGYRSHDYNISLNSVRKYFEHYYYINIADETIPSINIQELLNEKGLKGLFAKKMMEKIKSSKTEEERYLLEKSLYYGIEALENGKVEV